MTASTSRPPTAASTASRWPGRSSSQPNTSRATRRILSTPKTLSGASGHYARPPMETVQLRDGSTVTIRPIEPSDTDHMRQIWDGMSELSRRRRFLAPSSGDVSDADLQYLVDVDHRRHEALLAFDPQGRAVAGARYVRTPDDREAAEVAV